MGCNASSGNVGTSLFHAQYSLGEVLARGSFGQVHACTSRHTASRCAVKVVKADSLMQKIKANEDAFVWQRVGSHRNVVSLHECFSDTSQFYFVMELCERTFLEKLQERESRRECILEYDVLDTFRQILAGLRHCHSKRIAHRDVRPGTFLVDAHGVVKLSDFGSSALVPLDGLFGYVGNCSFMPPEMVRQLAYGCKTDVWSLGVSAYLCFYGDYPYKARDADASIKSRDTKGSSRSLDSRIDSLGILEAIASEVSTPQYKVAEQFSKVSKHVQGFIQELLQRCAVARPDVCEASGLLLIALGQANRQTRKAAIMKSQARLGDHLQQHDIKQKKMIEVALQAKSDREKEIKRSGSKDSNQTDNVGGMSSSTQDGCQSRDETTSASDWAAMSASEWSGRSTEASCQGVRENAFGRSTEESCQGTFVAQCEQNLHRFSL
mmetsp:Transcript_109571/g.172786  ORF Transcript_109571/g.172786 Transcript_109571/m.172786 type:complete len:437 (+) Transcript_109571:30-1340(+)